MSNLDELRNKYNALSEVKVPDDLRERVHSLIQNHSIAVDSSKSKWKFAALGSVAAALAAVSIVVGGLYAERHVSPSQRTNLVALSGTREPQSLELVSGTVQIIRDKSKLGSIGITEGKNKGEQLVPTALYYTFTLKTIGHDTIGDVAKQGMELKIVPNKNLLSVLEDVVGFNVFSSAAYMGTGLGYGVSGQPSILQPNQEGEYILFFDLGVSQKDPQVPVLVPSVDKLKRLESSALDCTLIVTVKNKEIARFDLSKSHRT
jgi:hypothetical protein